MENNDAEVLFDAQVKRELQMNALGIQDLRRQTRAAEDRQYASHTIYGSIARKDFTLKISAELRSRFNAVKRGKAMNGAKALNILKDHLSWDRVAYIALSTMLDYAGIPKKYGRLNSTDKRDIGLITTTELYFKLAKRIMVEANLQHLRKHFRHKYKAMKEEFFTEHASFDQKITRIKRQVRGLNKFFTAVAMGDRWDVPIDADSAREISDKFRWVEWPGDIQVQVGSLVARVVNDVTGFFADVRSFNEKGKQQNLFTFSKNYDLMRDAVMQQSEDFAFFCLPLLIPPKQWIKPEDPENVQPHELGGYHFSGNAFYKHGAVRGYRRGTVISQTTFDFINQQQEVGFRIDKEILEIQRTLADKGWSILGENEKDEQSKDAFRPYRYPEPHEIPKLEPRLIGVKKPKEGDSQEHRDLYTEKKTASIRIARWHDRQEELKQLAKPVNRFFRIVKHIENDTCFYFPWSLDWRGRCYPMVDALNPQGPEYQKAVLSFAEPVPVDNRTEFWLKVGIGSAAGQDKESFESRVAWTNANINMVKHVGNDPLGRGFNIWTNMPEPWIFLRACIEYRRIFQENQQYTNISCLGMDATQSGLQLLGGMVLCQQTCDLVNCVPGHDKPQDAYGTVLQEAVRLIEEADGSFPVHKVKGRRKLVKTPVMTKVYAAGHNTRVGQIRKALAKEGIRLAQTTERNEEMVEYFTSMVEQAMINTIPGVDLILSWFQKVVETAFERGVEDIVYETPSGNRVVVEYREPLTKQIQTESLGNTVCSPVRSRKQGEEFKARVVVGRGDTDHDDVKRAVAANFTHGAGDASLLHNGFGELMVISFSDVPKTYPFVTTHDCVYSPPSRLVDINHERVREAFIKVCRSESLQKFADLNRCSDITPPIVGTYNPDSVRFARYFFC